MLASMRCYVSIGVREQGRFLKEVIGRSVMAGKRISLGWVSGRGQGATQQVVLEVILNQHYLRLWRKSPLSQRHLLTDSASGKEELASVKALKKDF